MTENQALPLPNLPVLTVGDLSRAIRSTLENGFEHVRIRGEISNFKRHGSGHLYFSMKDDEAVIDACCWRSSAIRLAVAPEDGLEVVCTGRITTYQMRSKYQLIVETIELAGQGALLKLLEDRRKRLAAEGLFDEGRRKRLPFLPDVIGVVTSATGAVIRDILHRLGDRFPRHVLLWPVAVQGEGAAEQIARAITGFNGIAAGMRVPRPDLLIVARGGGSLEDLWAFNEEVVVRAIAGSAIPIISAIGHETDTTLADLAADRRAPTPTAAAEMAVPVRADLLAGLRDRERRLIGAADRLTAERRIQVDGLARGLRHPSTLVDAAIQRVDEVTERLRLAAVNDIRRREGHVDSIAARRRHPREVILAKEYELASAAGRLTQAMQAHLERARTRFLRSSDGGRMPRAIAPVLTKGDADLTALAGLLESYSFRDVLRRGFALIEQADGYVTSVGQVEPGSRVTVELVDGTFGARVDGAEEALAKPTPVRRRQRQAAGSPGQGQLL